MRMIEMRQLASDTLIDIFEKRDVIYDDNQVKSIYQKLISYTGQSEEVKQKHIDNLNRNR